MKMRLLTMLAIACLMSGAIMYGMGEIKRPHTSAGSGQSTPASSRAVTPAARQPKATKQQWNNLISAVTHFKKAADADNEHITAAFKALLASGQTQAGIVKWLKARRPKVSAAAIEFVQKLEVNEPAEEMIEEEEGAYTGGEAAPAALEEVAENPSQQ